MSSGGRPDGSAGCALITSRWLTGAEGKDQSHGRIATVLRRKGFAVFRLAALMR
jgi:hypothetical protein